MAVMLSPGVYPQEIDFTTYVQSLATSVLGLVGVFQKGEVDTPILVTKDDYQKILGDPVSGYYSMYALKSYFDNGGSRAYVVRVTEHDTTTKLSKAIKASTTLVNATAENLMKIEAKTPGSWGNNLTVTVTANATSGYNIVIKENEVEVESHTGVELATCSSVDSDYVTFTDVSGTATDKTIVAVTDQALTGGDDGLTNFTANDYIGDESAKTGLHALSTVDDISLLAIPGAEDANAINAMITFCENRKDVFFITETPQGLSVQEAVDFRKGQGSYTHSAFNSSYGAMYYPWIKISDSTGTKVIPPSGAVAGRYAYNDEVEGVWNSPAGFQKSLNIGVLKNVLGTEQNLNKAEMDALFPEGINPIANFSDGGTVIWGDKTLLSTTSALQDVNVRRMMIYVEKAIANSAKYFVFRPNDKKTWNEFIRTVEPFLRDLRDKGAFYDFLVVCDETTNTPSAIDQNQMIANIYVKPTRTARYIGINFIMTSSGTNFTELMEA